MQELRNSPISGSLTLLHGPIAGVIIQINILIFLSIEFRITSPSREKINRKREGTAMKILTKPSNSIVDMYERQITKGVADKTKHMDENEFSRILDHQKRIEL